MLSYAAYIAAAASPSLLRTTQSPTSQNFHRLKPVQVRVRMYLHIHLGMSQAPLQLSPLCSAQFLDLIQGFPNFRLWRSSWRALIFAGAPYENFTFEGASNLSVFVDIFFLEHLLLYLLSTSAPRSTVWETLQWTVVEPGASTSRSSGLSVFRSCGNYHIPSPWFM